MALDGLVVHALVHELQIVVGGRISKIHQPSPSDIVLQIRAQADNMKLLISANPTYPRVHFTRKQYVNPTEAPMFCMLLRKHFEGAVIEAVEQIGAERVIRLHARQRDELGDISLKTIIVEIMGRHSNIILLDPKTNTVLDGIHHVTPAISSYRLILPGSGYTEPPDQGKADPFTADPASFRERIGALGDSLTPDYAKAIVSAYGGIGPLIAEEMAHRAVTEAAAGASLLPTALWNAFADIVSRVKRHEYTPLIQQAENTDKQVFAVVELTHIRGQTERFSSVSECLESYYGDKAERDTVKQRAADLQKLLQNERAKNIKKLEKLRQTVEEAKDADRFRRQGELLTASLHTFNKGDKQAEVVNYYDEEQRPLVIALDPLLTPSENSQRYFKKYSKAKNSLTFATKQIEATHEEIRYIDGLLQQIGSASVTDIAEIREELVEQGYLRGRNRKNAKKKKKDKPSLTLYTSSEGIAIYVGKNNLQNEYLTNRLAQGSDTWLHTKDIPGSHVVIRGSVFGEATLHEAAQLAAYYSQAKASSRVPVDYTLVRHVRKPSGAKPGFVIYDRQKTLFVNPDETLVKQMKSSPV